MTDVPSADYVAPVLIHDGRPWNDYSPGYPDPDRDNSVGPEKIKVFPLEDRDVIVAGFPKSGTNWLQIQINELYGTEYWESTRISEDNHVPTFDLDCEYELLVSVPSPRLLKTHLWREVMPQRWPEHGKVVHITRNPKDVCVSYFTTLVKAGRTTLSWNEFVEGFAAGKTAYGPFTDNVLGWETYDHPNLLNIRYEEMKRDPLGVMTTVADFLGTPYDQERLRKTVAAADFDAMQKNGLAAQQRGFHLGGKSGGWAKKFTKEQSDLIDREIDARLRAHGIHLDYQ